MYEVCDMSEPIITISNASIRFNLAMQKQMGLGEYFRTILKRERRFQEFFALKDVSWTINAGESWGIIGRNGSGKSTLLKMISGILQPYEGSVQVNGQIAPLLELGAGFDMELTGRENIIMNALILGMSKKEISEKFDSIVEFSELHDFLDVPLKNYSSGMKSRLGFAVATTARADILIADEVLSTGDRLFQQKCEKRMRDLLDGGTTLLFVSHSTAAIRRMCTKVLWLDHGKIVRIGDTETVMEEYEKLH
jgi:ABC-type polysaccharide/polyol phosphate transport system ATPase subunit